MDKSFVLKVGGKEVKVKNLGWMLRHWKGIDYIDFNYSPKNGIDGQLFAKMKNGDCYFSDFADFAVLWEWLDRPIFRGVKFNVGWADKISHFIIGDLHYRTFDTREKLMGIFN